MKLGTIRGMRVSKCFANARKVPALYNIPARARAGIDEDRLCTITAGTLQKEILALSARRRSICNATATYAVTPINIDQAQQWLAGKRIDILYFPPSVDWLPPRASVCYSNCDTGTNYRIRCPRRDSTHDEMLMDENDTVGRFMNGRGSSRARATRCENAYPKCR